MSTVKVTPLGAKAMGYGGRLIELPAPDLWEDMEIKPARASGSDRIAPANFEEYIEKFTAGENINLTGYTGKGRIRLGVSLALTLNGEPALGQFDGGHRSRPHHLTPAAGVYEGGWPLNEAFRELCEEMIVRSERNIAYWRMHGLPTFRERDGEYASRKGLNYAGGRDVRLTTSDLHTVVRMGDAVYQVLIAWEPDTSALELIFTGAVSLSNQEYLVDGEQIPGGEWRDTPIITGGFEHHPLTTKAEIFLAAHKSGLRPIP